MVRMIPSSGTRRSLAEKYDERRVELAESALLTLGELGYARTSLRDIAANSPFSHGVLHYYFADKLELVLYSVRHHKQRCVTRYDEVVETAGTEDELVGGIAERLVAAVVDEAPMHRLWYDLRVESMFDPRLRETVLTIDGWLRDMVWRIVARYAELAQRPPALAPDAAYAVFDGIFQSGLLGFVTGDRDALPRLADQARSLLPVMLAPAGRVEVAPVA